MAGIAAPVDRPPPDRCHGRGGGGSHPRLHAAHLAGDVSAEQRAALRGHLLVRVHAMRDRDEVPAWERSAVLDTLLAWADADPELLTNELDAPAWDFINDSLAYFGDDRPRTLTPRCSPLRRPPTTPTPR